MRESVVEYLELGDCLGGGADAYPCDLCYFVGMVCGIGHTAVDTAGVLELELCEYVLQGGFVRLGFFSSIIINE